MKLIRSFIFQFFTFLSLSASLAVGQITLNPLPTRVLGQNSTAITSVNPNLVEGREFYAPSGIALDPSTNPPALYVSDTANNRVLGFRSASGFSNGQHADLVLGQIDFASTFPQGPTHNRSIGMSSPTGIAVDAHGNVYIVDSGNNRILRFPQPFAQGGTPVPDLVIGQTTFSTSAANQGGISAATLSFTSTPAANSNTSHSPLQAFLTFDGTGNLWVSDAGNNRVLRFPAAALVAGSASGPAADLVIGQSDFVTGTYTPGPSPLQSLTSFTTPSGIAFDSGGRLFVAESSSTAHGRILVWTPPFSTAEAASGLLGVSTDATAAPPVSASQMSVSPGALFSIGESVGVADTFNSRILVYPPFDQWNPDTLNQPAVEVAGQADFSTGTANRGNPGAEPDGFAGPAAALFYGNELYVADTFNNRVVVMPLNIATFDPATRVLGQDQFNQNAINLAEGREFNFGTAGSADAGLAVDLTSNPPRLYVADTYNNRILGYNDLRNLTTGGKADIVIGQPDFQQVLANYPNNNATKTNNSGLFLPTGLVVDTDGNLFVADRGNGRVLRFPKPFENYSPGVMMQADLVLGQTGFSATKITDPTSRTMSQPYGLAFTLAGGLLVSDIALNRVLYFQGPSSSMQSGMNASIVIGQPDFNSSAPGSGAGQMKFPRHISSDTDDRLYVADTGNGRVEIFDHAPTSGNGQTAAQILTNGLSAPYGMYVSPATGDIWVADASAGALRYAAFNQLILSGGTPNATLVDNAFPIAVVEDAWGDMFLADAVHRVGIYYPGLVPINAANFLNARVLAPGMIAALYSQGNTDQFGGQASPSTALPLPTTLNGVQVLFNGSPVPLFYADANQINFQVPNGAPQSGTADLQVKDVATGRILGDTTVLMTNGLPGLFASSGTGIGALAALNQDGTVNSQTNPAAQGTIITLFGTGQGYLPAAPPDGNIANGQVPTVAPPVMIMGTAPVPGANITYSGLAPTLVGVWQINVKIPDTVITQPNSPVQVVILWDSIFSGGGGLGRLQEIYVKQK